MNAWRTSCEIQWLTRAASIDDQIYYYYTCQHYLMRGVMAFPAYARNNVLDGGKPHGFLSRHAARSSSIRIRVLQACILTAAVQLICYGGPLLAQLPHVPPWLNPCLLPKCMAVSCCCFLQAVGLSALRLNGPDADMYPVRKHTVDPWHICVCMFSCALSFWCFNAAMCIHAHSCIEWLWFQRLRTPPHDIRMPEGFFVMIR